MPTLLTLPNELLLHIISYLTPSHLARLTLTCHDISHLCAEPLRKAVLSDPTSLHWASKHGDLPLIELLLSHGRDIASLDTNLRTPLHAAVASHSGKISGVSLLISQGASIHVRDMANDTPLHSAVSARNMDAVLLLLSMGADVNASGWHENTPLHVAVKSYMPPDLRLILLLLDCGANENKGNRVGHTAAECTGEWRPGVVSWLLEREAMRKEGRKETEEWPWPPEEVCFPWPEGMGKGEIMIPPWFGLHDPEVDRGRGWGELELVEERSWPPEEEMPWPPEEEMPWPLEEEMPWPPEEEMPWPPEEEMPWPPEEQYELQWGKRN